MMSFVYAGGNYIWSDVAGRLRRQNKNYFDWMKQKIPDWLNNRFLIGLCFETGLVGLDIIKIYN